MLNSYFRYHTGLTKVREIKNEIKVKLRETLKKILPQIAETAAFHKEVCENLFFPENFKKCIDCGETLLLTERNWVRRRRANDGFAPRCKKCEKIRRKGG